MTSRERVLAAFRFEPTDRFPLDIMENNIWPTLFNYFHNTYGLNSDEEILTHLGCDTRWLVFGPGGTEINTVDDNLRIEATFSDDAPHILSGVETVEQVRERFRPQVSDIVFPDFKKERELHPDHAIVFCPAWMPLFSGACDAFGMEEAMINLYEAPELIDAYVEIQTEYAISVFEKGLENGGAEFCDFAWMADDFCDNRGPMLSPALWREKFKPHLARIAAAIKKYNIPLLFHSCGSVESFIPDLIEIGVNGLCVVQTSANNMKLADLAEKYRNQIVFWGAVDAQQVLPKFTPEEVEAEVLRNQALFPSGGYVVANSHHSMPDMKGENIEAMCRAVKL